MLLHLITYLIFTGVWLWTYRNCGFLLLLHQRGEGALLGFVVRSCSWLLLPGIPYVTLYCVLFRNTERSRKYSHSDQLAYLYFSRQVGSPLDSRTVSECYAMLYKRGLHTTIFVVFWNSPFIEQLFGQMCGSKKVCRIRTSLWSSLVLTLRTTKSRTFLNTNECTIKACEERLSKRFWYYGPFVQFIASWQQSFCPTLWNLHEHFCLLVCLKHTVPLRPVCTRASHSKGPSSRSIWF